MSHGTRAKYGPRGWVLVVVVLGLLAGACSGGEGSNGGSDDGSPQVDPTPTDTDDAAGGDEQPQAGGELTVRHIQDVTSLDPVAGASGFDHHSLFPLYDRLINLDPDTLEPVPGLVESWEFEDETTLALSLREGISFHDGTPFNAEAVVFNLDRARQDDVSVIQAELGMIESVEARNTYEVVVNLTQPDTSLLGILGDRAGMMVSPTAVEKHGEDLGSNPVGTGPFRFGEWVPGDRLVVERNPDYWQDGLPYLDQLTFRYITAADTAVNALLTGDVDAALQLDLQDVETVEGEDGVEVSVFRSLWLDHCYFNFESPPFDSVEARLAMNHAIDREAFNQAFAFGLGDVAHQVFPSGYWAHSDDREGFFEYDPERARELLAEAGYPDGVEIHGVTTNATDFGRLNEIVQAQLAESGFEMTFEQMEPAASGQAFFVDLEANVYCSAWSGRPDASQTALSLFGPDSFFNAGKYAAPGMAEALDAAAAGQTLEERAAAFEEVIRISQEEALHVPLMHRPEVNAYSSDIEGFPETLGKEDISFVWLED